MLINVNKNLKNYKGQQFNSTNTAIVQQLATIVTAIMQQLATIVNFVTGDMTSHIVPC
jgi:uncharacterized Fe-S radical SAM superfamily protein PflX